MDRLLHQLTVLASATCIGLISMSMLFPASRQANLSNLSPDIANRVSVIDLQN